MEDRRHERARRVRDARGSFTEGSDRRDGHARRSDRCARRLVDDHEREALGRAGGHVARVEPHRDRQGRELVGADAVGDVGLAGRGGRRPRGLGRAGARTGGARRAVGGARRAVVAPAARQEDRQRAEHRPGAGHSEEPSTRHRVHWRRGHRHRAFGDHAPILPDRAPRVGSSHVPLQRHADLGGGSRGNVAARRRPRTARDHLGEGRLRPPGAVRMLHGADRRGRPGGVRDPDRAGDRTLGDDRRGAHGVGTGGVRRHVLARPAPPSAGSAPRGSLCGLRPWYGPGGSAAPTSTRPSPPTCVAAPAGCRSTTPWPSPPSHSTPILSPKSSNRHARTGAGRRRGPGSKAASPSGSTISCRSAVAASQTTRPARGRARRPPSPLRRLVETHRPAAATSPATATRERATGRRSRRPGWRGWSPIRSKRPDVGPARSRAARRLTTPDLRSRRRRPVGVTGVRLRTSWTEPAYLEPDASWCLPDRDPANPLGNAGAFGAKSDSAAPRAAREARRPLPASRAGPVQPGGRRPAGSQAPTDRGHGVDRPDRFKLSSNAHRPDPCQDPDRDREHLLGPHDPGRSDR